MVDMQATPTVPFTRNASHQTGMTAPMKCGSTNMGWDGAYVNKYLVAHGNYPWYIQVLADCSSYKALNELSAYLRIGDFPSDAKVVPNALGGQN